MNAPPEPIAEPSSAKRANRLLLDCALVVGFAAAVVLGMTFYLRTPAQLSDASGALPPKAPPHAITAVAKDAVLQMTIGTPFARIHTAPTTRATVIATVKRGAQVSLLERQGVWARVHVGANRGNPASDGWVIATSLREAAGH